MSAPLIRDRGHAAQLKDFGSLRFGSMSPTDIDAFLEVGDRAFVVIEVKTLPGRLHAGQRLALERLVDALAKVRPAVLIVGVHAPNGDADVDVGRCAVTRFRTGGEWQEPAAPITVREFTECFLVKQGIPIPAGDPEAAYGDSTR